MDADDSLLNPSTEASFNNVPIEVVHGTSSLQDSERLSTDMSNLSKNQQKKLLKKKVMLEKRFEKRKAERQRKKERRAKMREAGIPLPKRIRLKHCSDVQYSDLRVVLDLDFYDLMKQTDLRMVLNQVKSCYAVNRKVENPFQLYVTSFCEEYKALFSSLQPGYVSWQVNIESSNYLEVFNKADVVYLTADSENILETMHKDKVYVIGGLVDHNQHKNICYERAKEKGIAHAQLPIGQYVKLNSRKVLTINHVFEILLHYKESQDWKKSFFEVIPKRKGVGDLFEEDDANKPTDEADQ